MCLFVCLQNLFLEEFLLVVFILCLIQAQEAAKSRVFSHAFYICLWCLGEHGSESMELDLLDKKIRRLVCKLKKVNL